MSSYGEYRRQRRRGERRQVDQAVYQERYESEAGGVRPYDPEREKWSKRLGPFWGPVLLRTFQIAVVLVAMFLLLLLMGRYAHL